MSQPEEIKGSHRDFSGTNWVSIPLPKLADAIRTWVSSNLAPEQIVSNAAICKN